MDTDKIDVEQEERVVKEFKLSSLALKNKNTVYLLTLVLIFFGLFTYISLPKELFPDVAMPYVMVQTIYPGNPPVDMENLVTRPIEKEIESIKGLKNLTSVSSQDASSIFIEFSFDVDVKDALQDVKDAVDKVRSDLPNDLPTDPIVQDIDFSEFPIININLSGDYSIDELKGFAEILEEEIETIYEVSKAQIQGVNEKEIKINVDQHKLEAFKMSFRDIENAIAQENVSISGGEIKLDGTRRSVRTIGEFTSIKEIENIIVKHEDGIVYLRDVAEVIEGYEDATSYARLDKEPVVSIQVIKKGGENLLSATAQISDILKNARETKTLPENLKITITNDQSDQIKMQLSNLENSMMISIILVVTILFFFLGTRNALFVGLAIPLSMFMSFLILGVIDFRINMIVLFAMILALGMLVDNAIVVVENIYRFVDQGYSKLQAAKLAVGEIAIPIIASTATTLAAFFPLIFWDSMIGEFMKYLPITLIIVLGSSLFVALVIIPVFSSTFVKKDAHNELPNKKRALKIAGILVGLAIIAFLMKIIALGNIFMVAAIITTLNAYIFSRLGQWFQNVFLIRMENGYHKFINYTLKGHNPVKYFVGTIVLLLLTFVLFAIRKPNVEFFPPNDPSYINVMAELPIGTDIDATNNFMYKLEAKVDEVMVPYKHILKSTLTNIGEGAKSEGDRMGGGFATNPNKGLITLTFVDFDERGGINTSDIMKTLSNELINKYPGVLITIEKNRMGPPTGKPINLEVSGKDYDKLISISDTVLRIIEQANIPGIEGMKMDLELGKPEMLVSIDRDKARRFGLSTAQIASTIRTALFGKEVSNYKIGEDEYPIQLRMKEEFRYNVASLMNQKIAFRDNRGKLKQVPISAVADFSYSTTYGAVKRKDVKRVITLYSNVIEGYNATSINEQITKVLENYAVPEGYSYKFTGEQQEQQESMAFLITAMILAISLIVIILVSQFNSIVKPFIIMASVLFSTIGVFGGIALFNMDFVVVMTGIGIVSLAGVVVNNAIVLIDYIDILKRRKRQEMGLSEKAFLPIDAATECIIQAGKTRLRPVLLTAITTILGLIPMAIGLNIDFTGLFNEYKPNIYIGGDMAHFWGPISWTVIFGLTFATFLTLVIVPVMYRLATQVNHWCREHWGKA